MILMKAYEDANGEIVYVREASFQDLDSVAGSLTRIPALDYNISADLQNNLDLDGKIDDSQLVDDDSFATASATNIPSAESVKAYVDAQIQTKDEADEIGYDNTTSGLAATDVQAAVDEVEGRVDVTESDITANSSSISSNAGLIATNSSNITTSQADITELELNQDDLVTLTGVAENSTNLGTFTGVVIGDNVTIKTALQQIESSLSSVRITDVFVVADIPARDALATQDEGDVAVVLDDGTGRRHSYIYDGAAWQDLKTGDIVSSVNTQTGDVVLTTDDVAEGSTNLYHTITRARTAAVVNSTAGTEIDQAASVAAMKTYVAAQLATQDEASEITYDNTTSGLTATNSQAAIDEVEARVDIIESIAKDFIYANQTVAQTAINGTSQNLVFDNDALQSPAAVFSLNTTTGELAINKTGIFKIDYRATADTNDGTRRTTETLLEIDTGSGFAEISASLGSSRAYSYNRNNASGENTASAQAILNVTTGDVIRIRIRRSNGTGIVQTVPSGTSISVEEK